MSQLSRSDLLLGLDKLDALAREQGRSVEL